MAVVRLSGLLSWQIADRVVHRRGERNPWEMFHSRLIGERGDTVDEGNCVYFKGPRSFTGEDSVEITIHGGPVSVERTISALVAAGAAPALPGEFTFRAVRSGKISVPQARATAELIGARNEAAHRLALDKLTGAPLRWLMDLAEGLRGLAALGELSIDFSDQDVGEIDELSEERLRARLGELRDRVYCLRDSYEVGRRISNGVQVAILGLPNAGKSSLFNAILGSDRSIVSSVPGTTRDAVSETIGIRAKNGDAAVSLRFVDTAGIRETPDEVESEGVTRALRQAVEADLVLVCLDAAAKENEDPADLLSGKKRKYLGVLTRSDLVPADLVAQLAGRLVRQTGQPWMVTSAKTGRGIPELVEKVLELTAPLAAPRAGEWVLTQLEEVRALDATIPHLDRAMSAPSIELFAADVRQALSALAPLIGNTSTEDVLTNIFANFCIGK